MTILAAFKALMVDTDNKCFPDTDYVAFLEVQGIDPAASYSAASSAVALQLIKAEFLDAIAGNPSLFNSYTKGAVSETITKADLSAEADKIRRRHLVVS